MKIKYIILFLAVLPFLSSCMIDEFYVYVHEPTNSIKSCLWDTSYESADCLNGENLVLIPDFRSFTPSFSTPFSRVIVCSKNDTISISKAILRIKGEETETELSFSKSFPVKKPMGKSGYNIAWIVLFDDENTEFSKYKMKEKLELEIQYSPTDSKQTKKEYFQLELKKKKDITWPT